jgi:single-strand DNA-binding protein
VTPWRGQNLVRDPQYRTTPKGTPVCTFSLASNRYFKQDRWLGQDGKPRARIMIVAEHVEFRPEFIETAKEVEREGSCSCLRDNGADNTALLFCGIKGKTP